MACGICKKTGHRRETCPAVKVAGPAAAPPCGYCHRPAGSHAAKCKRRPGARVAPASPSAPPPPSGPRPRFADVLVMLRAERDKLDALIAGLEALG